MQYKSLTYSFLLALVLMNVTPCSADSARKTSIRDFDFKHYFLTFPDYSQCRDDVSDLCKTPGEGNLCPDGLSLSVTYPPTPKNTPEFAIVIGNSCYTGTAGPDIHDVYMMQDDGSVKKVERPSVQPTGVLFGNRNYDLVWEDGFLVQKYRDTSGRKDPLVIRYQWKDGQFHVESVRPAPMYHTSYDCSKTREESEQAICYVEDLAKRDVALDHLYQQQLSRVSAAQKSKLIADQRRWMTARNKKCPIYKWWVECLQDEYKRRTVELESLP